MKTQEILSIVALGLLGVCLLCGLAKMAMKGDKAKKSCDHVCSLSFFVAVVLLGVSQLITEEGYWQCEKVKVYEGVLGRTNFSCIEEKDTEINKCRAIFQDVGKLKAGIFADKASCVSSDGDCYKEYTEAKAKGQNVCWYGNCGP